MDDGRELKHAREQVAIAVRYLGGTVQLEDVARRVVASDRTASLERHAGMASDRQFELDDNRRGAQDRVDVAITLADHGYFRAAAGRKFAGLGVGGEQDRHLLDVERDEIHRVLG